MYPYIDILGLKFAVYDIFSFIGFVLQYLVFMYAVKKRGGLIICAREVQLLSLFGGIAGMKLLYALTRYDLWNAATLDVIFGGGVFYGGLFGAFLSGLAVLKLKGVEKSSYTDAGAVALPLFHSFGRCGCFFSGCCYGIESECGFMLEGVRRFPIQLLSAVLLLMLFCVLLVLFEKDIFKGQLLYVYLAVYATGRFFVEFLRGDDIRGKIWIFSTSQLISIFLLILLLILYNIRKQNKINGK